MKVNYVASLEESSSTDSRGMKSAFCKRTVNIKPPAPRAEAGAVGAGQSSQRLRGDGLIRSLPPPSGARRRRGSRAGSGWFQLFSGAAVNKSWAGERSRQSKHPRNGEAGPPWLQSTFFHPYLDPSVRNKHRNILARHLYFLTAVKFEHLEPAL